VKRRNFKAVVVTETGLDEIGTKDTFAWNSAIKATETIMREHARDTMSIYHGDKPVVMEAGAAGNDTKIYRRNWTNAAGNTLQALVWEVI
jgi:hypothetical protein